MIQFFNSIFIFLTTENELLVNLMYIPMVFVEAFAQMSFFTTFLKVSSTKKQKLIYVISVSVLGIFCAYIIPKPFSNIITLVTIPLVIKYIFKINILRSVFAEFVTVAVITSIEIVLAKLVYISFGLVYEECSIIPLYRFLINNFIYIILILFSIIIKKENFSINFFSNFSKKNKCMLFFNILFAFNVIFMQMYLISYYTDVLPSHIVFFNLIFLIVYSILSIYSLVKTMNLARTEESLEQEKLSNKTLQILHDNIRAFKHDFANIIAGLGGYIETNDMEGLKKYYSQLLVDCTQLNNLSSLSPDAINSPAVYAVLANKYYKADNLGIKISLECFIDFNNLNMQIYEFTRILGILMDNAIEASSECDEKIINVVIRSDFNQHRQLLIIENTYKDKSVNLDKIYEKGFSTKEKNTGLGLWEVNKIIKRHKNLARFTTKDDKFFKQQIEIYEK